MRWWLKHERNSQGGAGQFHKLRGAEIQEGATTSEFLSYLAGEVKTGENVFRATTLDTHYRCKAIWILYG